MKKSILSIMLLAAMLLVSCSQTTDGGAADTTTARNDAFEETTVAADEGDERANAVSSVDPSVDLGGLELRFGYANQLERYVTDIIGEQDGDVVNDAVYNRNIAVEDKLNMKIIPVIVDDNNKEAADKIKTTVLAGEAICDVNIGHQAYLNMNMFDGVYMNLADLEHVDYSKPWWNYEYMKELTIGEENIFFLFGDISLMMLKSAGAVFFNKELFEDYFQSPEELYQTVLDGNWTFDMFHEYTSKSYNDLNGNGTADEGDLYGFAATTSKSVEHFQYDAGIVCTTRDEDGIPRLTLNNERTVDFANRFYSLYYENPGAKIFVDDQIDKMMLDMFKNDELMFNPNWFYTCELLRDMEADYGIIPYPKLNEEQETYLTLVHDGTTTFCVPSTTSLDLLDSIGAVLEEMAFQSYQLVTPAYFDVAMKEKYSRDNLSSQMLDIIHENTYTNFGYVYSSTLKDLGMLRPLAREKSADFASYYATREEAALLALDNLIDIYMNIGK